MEAEVNLSAVFRGWARPPSGVGRVYQFTGLELMR